MPRPIAVRILLLAISGGILADIAVPGNAPGVNIGLLVGSLVASAVAVAGRDGLRRMDPADAWLAPAALLLGGMVAIRADPWLVAADIVLAAVLVAGTIASLAGARITRGLVPQILAVTAGVVAAGLVGAADVLAATRGEPGPPDRSAMPGGVPVALRAGARRLAPVGRGLLVAVPLVVLFAALFASADAVFERLAREALAWRLGLDMGEVAGRATVVVIVAWVVAGLLALAGSRLPSLAGARWPSHALARDRSLGAASARSMARGAWFGGVEAATVLVILDALFAVFVLLQLAYLFGGRDTLAAAGLSYAAYARRGFFELVAVAVLAGTIVVVLDLAVARRSRVQLAASLGLLALTAIVLASALLRLRLYQDAYGWTELRFVVLIAIGWLAVALAVTGALLAGGRARWTLHVLGVLLLATIAGMNVAGPQAFVAERNLERAIDPSLVAPGGRSGLDAAYLASLGDEAVPAIVTALDRLPETADRVALEAFLRARASALREDPSLVGWPSWNAARDRARAALSAWEARASARLPAVDPSSIWRS
jgi:Domain of unknown function (DUF4153)